MTTLAPSCAKRMAQERPMPLDEPVMIAERPSSNGMLGVPPGVAGPGRGEPTRTGVCWTSRTAAYSLAVQIGPQRADDQAHRAVAEEEGGEPVHHQRDPRADAGEAQDVDGDPQQPAPQPGRPEALVLDDGVAAADRRHRRQRLVAEGLGLAA